MCAFHTNPNRIHTELTLSNLKAHCFRRPLKYLKPHTNSVDPDRSSLVWVHNVCLYAYVTCKSTFSDAVILLAF